MSKTSTSKFVPAAPTSVTLLKRGSKGTEVSKLQRYLKQHGFYPYTIDTDFGRRTAEGVIYFKQTHKGPTGDWLTNTDGKDESVTPAVWWALANASGPAQRDYLDAFIPRGLSESRKLLLRVAVEEHRKGVAEDPDGSNYGDGVTKYLENVGPTFWCAYCLSWVTKEGTGSWPLGKRFGLVRALWNHAKEQGRTYTDNPVPGDAFVILYKKNGRLTGLGHTGFVGATSTDWLRFSTFEGNVGNRFKAGTRGVRDDMLVGFIDLHGDAAAVRKVFKRGLFDTSESLGNGVGSTR